MKGILFLLFFWGFLSHPRLGKGPAQEDVDWLNDFALFTACVKMMCYGIKLRGGELSASRQSAAKANQVILPMVVSVRRVLKPIYSSFRSTILEYLRFPEAQNGLQKEFLLPSKL